MSEEFDQKVAEEFETWYDVPCFSTHENEAIAKGCAKEAYLASAVLRECEIDALKEQVRVMREALGDALFALRHPDDGWRNDVINRAMKICSEALAQGGE